MASEHIIIWNIAIFNIIRQALHIMNRCETFPAIVGPLLTALIPLISLSSTISDTSLMLAEVSDITSRLKMVSLRLIICSVGYWWAGKTLHSDQLGNG